MNALNPFAGIQTIDDWRACTLPRSSGLSDGSTLVLGRPYRTGHPLNPAAVAEAIHQWRARAEITWAWTPGGGFQRYLAAQPFDVSRRLAEVLANISLTRIPSLPPRKPWKGDRRKVLRLLEYQDEFTKDDVEFLVSFADWAAVLGDVDFRQPIDLTLAPGKNYTQPAMGPLLLAGVVASMTPDGSWKVVGPGVVIPLYPVWQPAPKRRRLSARSTHINTELWKR